MTTSHPTRRDADVPVFAMRRAMEERCPARAPVTHAYAAVAFYTGGQARMEQRGQWTLVSCV